MKKRPHILYLLGMSYALFSFALIWSLVQSKIALSLFELPYEISMLCLSGLALAFALNASPLLLITLPALYYHAFQYIGEIGQNVDFSHGLSEVLNTPFSFWLYVLFIGVQFLWLNQIPLTLLRNRKYHWWKTPPRIPTQSEAILRNQQGENILANIHNLSKSGLLLEVKNQSKTKNITQGTLLDIRFKLGTYNVVRCTCVVVRKHMNSLTQFGLKITHMDPDSKHVITQYIKHSMQISTEDMGLPNT